MAQKDKKIVTLLDVPQGATCVLVGWGGLETQDVKKLTDVGVFFRSSADRPECNVFRTDRCRNQ